MLEAVPAVVYLDEDGNFVRWVKAGGSSGPSESSPEEKKEGEGASAPKAGPPATPPPPKPSPLEGAGRPGGHGTMGDEVHRNKEESLGSDWKVPEDDKYIIKTFYRKLGSILLDNRRDRRVAGFRSGKLETRKLHKIASGSSRVFSRKQERLHKQYNFVISNDISGSMSNYLDLDLGDGMRRYEMQAYVDTILIEAIHRLKFNYTLTQWSHVIDPNSSVYKSWGDKKIDIGNTTVRKRLAREGGGNSEVLAVADAVKKLETAPEGENIVVWSTDGEFCANGGRPASDLVKSKGLDPMRTEDHLKYVQSELKRVSKMATPIIIGIGDEGINKIYKGHNPIIINSAQEYMNAVLKGIKKVIKRG